MGRSWGRLGAILGLSWAILGPSWGHLKHLGAILGPSWGHLGPSWGHLGVILGHLGPLLGPSWGHLGVILGHLGHLGAVLGHLGAISGSSRVYLAPFQAYDFGRRTMHSRLCKIRTSPTRDANFGIYGPDLRPLQSVLASSSGRLEAIPGPSWGHLGAILAHLGPSWGHFGPSWAVSGRRPTTA